MVNGFVATPSRILGVKPETDVEYTFTLQSNMKPDHGQFVEVSLPGIGEAPISVSGFGEGWIQLTIRAVGCLTREVIKRKEGDSLWLRGPYGVPFPAAAFRDRDLVVAAGGCAVAPVRSLILSRLNDPTQRAKTRLIFGFKSPESVLFQDELQTWKDQVQTIVTIDSQACTWNGRTGLITQHIKDIEISDPGQTNVVIVGPPVMMKFTAKEFLNRSISPQSIWVSFERRMACGLGKCGHCKIDNTYVCIDGPVLRYDCASHLLD